MTRSIQFFARIITLAFCLSLFNIQPAQAQGSAFTYQGTLNNNNMPGNGNFDFEFKLFDLLNTGIQQGATIQRLNVPVTNGNFTVTLDFGAAVFTGGPRFLEISVRTVGGGAFTLLAPRQPITATPYAIKSATATAADGLSAACVGCVTGTQIQAGGAYVNNTTTQQAGANFNIGGNGTIGGNMIANGNVGIGTSALSHALQVNGITSLGAPGGVYGFSVNNGTPAGPYPSLGFNAYYNGSTAYLAGMAGYGGIFQFQNGVGRLDYFTSPSVAAGAAHTFTPRFSILQNGNVGIGTFTPQASLHVNGDAIQVENAGKILRLETGAEVDLLSPTNSVVISGRNPQGNNHVILNPFPANNQDPAFRSGNVGIGTFTPQYKLHVNGDAIRYDNGGKTLYISSGSEVDVLSPTNSVVIQSTGPAEHNHVILSPFATDGSQPFRNGYVGVGTFSPVTKLHIEDNALTETTIQSRTERAILALDSNLGGQRRVWTLESGIFGQAGRFGIYDRTAQRERLGIGPDGVVGVDVLQIRGGADFSENFDVNSAPTVENETAVNVEPGMVVSIDPANPGKLVLSTQVYDRRVAGIISGAGGVKPGMVMSQEGTLAHGSHPVALSGRVYCLVDANQSAIEPGDLLTTSNTPGHAMKVTDPTKAQGAIIGKAMTSLKLGKGLVLVLVTLQ